MDDLIEMLFEFDAGEPRVEDVLTDAGSEAGLYPIEKFSFVFANSIAIIPPEHLQLYPCRQI
jgi:hypothetical protein